MSVNVTICRSTIRQQTSIHVLCQKLNQSDVVLSRVVNTSAASHRPVSIVNIYYVKYNKIGIHQNRLMFNKGRTPRKESRAHYTDVDCTLCSVVPLININRGARQCVGTPPHLPKGAVSNMEINNPNRWEGTLHEQVA